MDRQRLEAGVVDKYRIAAASPVGMFPYPVGGEGARRLGYTDTELAAVPPTVLERFVGVGRPFALRQPQPGERVLDLGCGAGTDVFVAAQHVGAHGHVVGIDLTPAMIAVATAVSERRASVGFAVGSASELPFPAGGFSQVTANGAFNLVVDKDAALREIARVLRPGGWVTFADLLVVDEMPQDVLASMDAWST